MAEQVPIGGPRLFLAFAEEDDTGRLRGETLWSADGWWRAGGWEETVLFLATRFLLPTVST